VTGGNLARLVGTLGRLSAIADGALVGPSLPRTDALMSQAETGKIALRPSSPLWRLPVWGSNGSASI
jgi:hypothetical protein